MGDSLVKVDILFIGAGPTGLFGAYCAGFRGLQAAVVDVLPEPGGQISALYPEKSVRDVAGIPSLAGRELVEALLTQARTFKPLLFLGQQATTLDRTDPDGLRVGLGDGTIVETGALVITGGIGSFRPRPLPAGEGWLGRGLSYYVTHHEEYLNRRVVIVGGGDSALDWANALAPLAESVTVVHRRNALRAHAASMAAALDAGVEFRFNAEVVRISGGDTVEKVFLAVADNDEVVAADAVIAALGFVSNLGPLAEWGLTLRNRSILVDQRMQTNLPRVYAAGDVTEYDGKVRLMAVGFGEVATAVNNAAVAMDPSLSLFPGHSTDHT